MFAFCGVSALLIGVCGEDSGAVNVNYDWWAYILKVFLPVSSEKSRTAIKTGHMQVDENNQESFYLGSEDLGGCDYRADWLTGQFIPRFVSENEELEEQSVWRCFEGEKN